MRRPYAKPATSVFSCPSCRRTALVARERVFSAGHARTFKSLRCECCGREWQAPQSRMAPAVVRRPPKRLAPPGSAQDRFRGALVGLAAGDALGAPVEFRPRGTFPPVRDMIDGGTHGLKAGQWTDDTSTALCLASSLVDREEFDLTDQIDRYCAWFEDGYWSSTGYCFDIGSTELSALRAYRRTGNPRAGSAEPHTAGNGCIMRLAPVALFFYPDEAAVRRYSAESATATHLAQECLDAADVLGRVIIRALCGMPKNHVLEPFQFTSESSRLRELARGTYRKKLYSQIRGSGQVTECLEAALWCFAHTGSFEDAVLKAVNLGDDADTTAAVCGQIAGSFYGERGIPGKWRRVLHRSWDIRDLADRLLRLSSRRAS